MDKSYVAKLDKTEHRCPLDWKIHASMQKDPLLQPHFDHSLILLKQTSLKCASGARRQNMPIKLRLTSEKSGLR